MSKCKGCNDPSCPTHGQGNYIDTLVELQYRLKLVSDSVTSALDEINVRLERIAKGEKK